MIIITYHYYQHIWQFTALFVHQHNKAQTNKSKEMQWYFISECLYYTYSHIIYIGRERQATSQTLTPTPSSTYVKYWFDFQLDLEQ